MTRDSSSNVCRFIRQPNATAPRSAFAEAIVDAVNSGLVVEFYDEHPVGFYPLAFQVRRHAQAVRIEDRCGVHLGTYADTIAAVTHGWNAIAAPRVVREAGK